MGIANDCGIGLGFFGDDEGDLFAFERLGVDTFAYSSMSWTVSSSLTRFDRRGDSNSWTLLDSSSSFTSVTDAL